jgi:hypothetical protein
MNAFDTKLSDDLRALLLRARKLRLNLRQDRPTCMCNEDASCAYHAPVVVALLEIEEKAKYALAALEAE